MKKGSDERLTKGLEATRKLSALAEAIKEALKDWQQGQKAGRNR